MPGTVRPKPASGVLHHSLIRRSPDDYVIESSYKSLTGALMNLKIDAANNTVDSSDGAESIIGDTVESKEEDEHVGTQRVTASQNLETSQAIERMAAMSLGVPATTAVPASPAAASHSHALRSRGSGATRAEPISAAIEKKLQPFLKVFKIMQRGTIDGCVSVNDLHIAVSSQHSGYLEFLDVERPTEYITKAQKYLHIVLVKIVGTMPYVKLGDLQQPWYSKVKDVVPSWKEQKAMIRNPPPSAPMDAKKLFPLIDILLHCVPPFQLLGNGQLKRCLNEYGGTSVKTKVDLIYYCEEATKLCNICVHLIWGGGYCVALREPERPFKEDSINNLYFARRLPASFNADEITAKALRR